MTTATKTFNIKGFHCTGCADNVSRSLGAQEGVIKVDADYEYAKVEVRFDSERITEERIIDQIRRAGFEAT